MMERTDRGRRTVLIIFLLLFPFYAHGQTSEEDPYEEPLYVYEFPEIRPELSLRVNYSLLEHRGSPRAGEFLYLNSSVGGEVFFKAFPFPHRIHIELEALNKEDYFGDIRYAYKDIVLSRGLTRGLFHNLDNRTLVDAGPLDYTIERRDPGKEYGTSNNISSLFLRLKTPDYPFHLFVDTQIIKREGNIQQRYLSHYPLTFPFPFPFNRVSMQRYIEWESRIATIGANTHLGPVEVELSRAEKRFDAGGDRLLEYSYNGNVYPHNLIPELRGSTTTFKIHTSYTGQIVASATLSRTERENETSSVKADYLVGAADFTYMPDVRFTIFLRYRHKGADLDAPEYIPVNYLGYPVYTSPLPVKRHIDFTSDKVAGTIRYRPWKKLTLYAEYSVERIERKNVDAWKIPEETNKNTLSLSALLKPLNSLDIKARYIHKEIDRPAYNNEPHTSDEGRFSLNWRPLKALRGLFMYSIAFQKREELFYYNGDIHIKAEDRKVKRERIFGSLTFLITERLSITPSYSLIRNHIDQTIVYDTSIPADYLTDPDVLYRDSASTYGMNINYIPKERLNLNLDITNTVSKGRFSPALISEINTIKEIETELDIRETAVSTRAEYNLGQGFVAGIRYSFIEHNDRRYDLQDGKLHLIFASISKRW